MSCLDLVSKDVLPQFRSLTSPVLVSGPLFYSTPGCRLCQSKIRWVDDCSLGNSLFKGLCLVSAVSELAIDQLCTPLHHLSTAAFIGQFLEQGISPYCVVCFTVVSQGQNCPFHGFAGSHHRSAVRVLSAIPLSISTSEGLLYLRTVDCWSLGAASFIHSQIIGSLTLPITDVKLMGLYDSMFF